MDKRDTDLLLEAINLNSQAVLKAAMSVQVATIASLMISFAEKGILAPAEISVFATRTADMCSQSLGQLPEGHISKVIGDALHFYVDELLKMAEHGIPGASSDAQ